MKRLSSLLLNCLLVLAFAMPWGVGAQAQESRQPEPTVAQIGQGPAEGATPVPEGGPSALLQPNPRLEAVRRGKWPAQLAAHSGAIQPDRHGPQRNDPTEGIPKHAYSPFDERRNRDYPCPPGGCEFVKDWALVKLAPQVKTQRLDQKGVWTTDAALNQALEAQGIARLEPVFPALTSTPYPPFPSPKVGRGEGGQGGWGESLPKPDLTRWYRAYLNPTQGPAITGQGGKQPDIYAVVEALRKAPGIAWAEPDYTRKLVGHVSRFTFHVQRSTCKRSTTRCTPNNGTSPPPTSLPPGSGSPTTACPPAATATSWWR